MSGLSCVNQILSTSDVSHVGGSLDISKGIHLVTSRSENETGIGNLSAVGEIEGIITNLKADLRSKVMVSIIKGECLYLVLKFDIAVCLLKGSTVSHVDVVPKWSVCRFGHVLVEVRVSFSEEGGIGVCCEMVSLTWGMKPCSEGSISKNFGISYSRIFDVDSKCGMPNVWVCLERLPFVPSTHAILFSEFNIGREFRSLIVNVFELDGILDNLNN